MLKSLKTILQNEIDPAFAKRASFIFEKIDEHKPLKVLDIGCGRGFYVYGLTQFAFIKEIHGIDLNPQYISVAKNQIKDKRVKIQEGSVYKIPFTDKYFDVVIASEILEHLKSDKKGLAEIKRVLKNDGVLLATVPSLYFPFLWDPLNWILMKFFNTHIHKDIWWLAGIWADHERLYAPEGIEQIIEKAGFNIKDKKNIHYLSWPFSHFLLYGIGKNIVERLGANSFNRFNFKEKPFSMLLARIMNFPSKLDIKNPKASVNIAIEATK